METFDDIDKIASESFAGHTIQMNSMDQDIKRLIFLDFIRGREKFTLQSWKDFLIRCFGFEPTNLTENQKNVLFVKMVPFVERNYYLLQTGSRGVGKSYFFKRLSPYAIIVEGSLLSRSNLFWNNSNAKPGLICKNQVLCFDEFSEKELKDPDIINMLKCFMEPVSFSVGQKDITGDSSIVFIGVATDLNKNLPIYDPALLDRIHAYVSMDNDFKINRNTNTNHLGLTVEFLSTCFQEMRSIDRVPMIMNRSLINGDATIRDKRSIYKTINGLIKLLCPDPEEMITDEIIEWAIQIAIGCRSRVRTELYKLNGEIFNNSVLGYSLKK